MSNYDTTGIFWTVLKEMSQADIESHLEADGGLWDPDEKEIARVYMASLPGSIEAADRIAELESQRDALVDLTRKGSRGAGLGLRLPIEGEIEKILQGGVDGDRNIEVPSGQLETSSEAPVVKVTHEGKASFRGESTMSARGHVTRATALGSAYVISDEDATPIREALAIVKAALEGSISEEEAGPGVNQKVLNVSREELDAINELVDFIDAGAQKTLWFESLLDGMNSFEHFTDQLASNLGSLAKVTGATAALLTAVTGLVGAWHVLVALL